MKHVEVSAQVIDRLDDLSNHIIQEYKAPDTARKKIDAIYSFLQSLGSDFTFARCRRKIWHDKKYHYTIFDHKWIFAYQIYADKIIVHDVEFSSHIKD